MQSAKTYGFNNILIKTLRFASIIIAMFCILIALSSNCKYPFWVLSVVYALGINLLDKYNIIYVAPGIITLNIVIFCRYSILPLFLYISNDLSNFALGYQYIDEAVWLMIFELITIFTIIYLTGKNEIVKSKIDNKETKRSFFEVKFGYLWTIIIVLLIIVLVYNYRFLVGGFSLITQGMINSEYDITNVSALIGILWQSSLAWLYIFLCIKCKENEYSGKNKTLLLISISIVYILLTFIGQISISRWYTVITFITVFFMFLKVFPNKLNIVVSFILIPVVVLIIVVSVYKNSTFLNNNIDFMQAFFELFSITTLDSYFAGPVSVNNAIYIQSFGNVGILSLFYDIVSYMPVINHLIDPNYTTVKIYGSFMGRNDQMLPRLGQSLIYFGYFLSPLLSALVIVVIRKLDAAYNLTFTPMFYAYAFASGWMGVTIILNLSICLSWFYIRIIPLMLLIKLTEIAGIREIHKNRICEDE